MLLGAAAGAAGTTALNAVTYLDMAIRGRPTSSAPEDTVEALAATVHARVPGDDDTRRNRVAGLGPLTGLMAGVGTGALLGAARGRGLRPGVAVGALVASLGALVGSDGPMTALGVTDPRSWPLSSWAADLVPHLVYGLVTAAVLERLDAGSPRG